MNVTVSDIIAVVMGAVSLVVSVVGWVGSRLRRAAQRVATIENRLTTVETKLEPLWRDVSFAAMHAAANLLHSPDNELGLDRYIEKFVAGEIAEPELRQFVELLQGVRDKGPTASKRYAADILLREIARRT